MTHGAPTMGQPDEIDRLFAAYFQHQMPEPWPAFAPIPTAVPARTAVEAGRSRATLAVSVAALLGAGLLLSSGPRPHTPVNGPQAGSTGLLKSASAKGPDLSKPLNDRPETNKGMRTP